MDVIEQVIENPHFLGILTYEFTIWGSVVCRLDQADVSSNDLPSC